jgi:restriction system protein
LDLKHLPFLTGVARALAARLSFLRKSEETPAPPSALLKLKLETRAWNLELLKQLEWRRFEELCVAYYETLGLKTRISGTGTEGGIDILLYETRSDEPLSLARCKAWDAYRVGAKPVRELRRAMTEAKVVDGLLLTAGRFTPEAFGYAASEGIRLIDGAGLLEMIGALPPEEAAGLLRFATDGDFLTPTCPFCSIKMVQRQSTKDGWKFWGCPNYPACKKTFAGKPFAPE